MRRTGFVVVLTMTVIAGGQNLAADLVVNLPNEKRPLPEPLSEGRSPGFRIRGIKGWNWTPEQYLEEIPVLAKYKMNFLMNCPLSMLSHHPQIKNEWWRPIPESRKRDYEQVIRACQQHGIDFCFAIHPQLWSPRPLDPTSDEDFEKIWAHFAWAQSVGTQWFCVTLDDVIGVRIDGAEHARLVNKLLSRVRVNDPRARVIFCPTWYSGDGSQPEGRPYLEALARDLDPDVYLFWTGPLGVCQRVTRRSAESYKAVVKHRLIIWDNYPVNDNNPTMHLGPLTGRDPDLCEVADGYISNPMCSQNQINRIPLLTCADYAYNPHGYDAARSIGQAILHLAETEEQRALLKDLVEAYPGMLLHGGGTGTNPVREEFTRKASEPGGQLGAEACIHDLENLSGRLSQAFPDRFAAARKALDADLAWMKEKFAGKYGE